MAKENPLSRHSMRKSMGYFPLPLLIIRGYSREIPKVYLYKYYRIP